MTTTTTPDDCANLARKILNFGADCLDESYTDTGDAWNLLNEARAMLAKLGNVEGELLTDAQLLALRSLGFDTEDAVRPDLGHAWHHVGEGLEDAVAHGAVVAICDGVEQWYLSMQTGHLRRIVNDVRGQGTPVHLGYFKSLVCEALDLHAGSLADDLIAALEAPPVASC